MFGKIKDWFDGGLASQVVYDTSVKTPEGWRTFAELGGTVGDKGQLMLNNDVVGQLQSGPSTDGKFLGMDGGTWQGVGSAFGVGKGLFDIFSGIQQGKLAKDYYKHQTRLQNEQMQMARDENKRIADTRSVLNTGYSGGA